MTTIGTGMMQAFTLHKHGIRSYKQLSIMLPILAIYRQIQSPFYGRQEEAIEWLAKWILCATRIGSRMSSAQYTCKTCILPNS